MRTKFLSAKDIAHSEYYVLYKKSLCATGQLSFMITLQDPPQGQYVIKVVSDRWVGVCFTHGFSVSNLPLPNLPQPILPKPGKPHK